MLHISLSPQKLAPVPNADPLLESSLSSPSAPSSANRSTLKLSSILRRAEQKALEYKRKRLVIDFPSSIDHFRFWRVFSWQENAFDAICDSRRRDLHVFSFETAFGEANAKGQSRRKFLGQSQNLKMRSHIAYNF